jgi:hypothetical protein
MDYQWYDFLGNIGVAMILASYLLLQLGKLQAQDLRYSILNAFGAALILCSLAFDFNMSAFLIEFFWLLISLIGIAVALKSGDGRLLGKQ